MNKGELVVRLPGFLPAEWASVVNSIVQPWVKEKESAFKFSCSCWGAGYRALDQGEVQNGMPAIAFFSGYTPRDHEALQAALIDLATRIGREMPGFREFRYDTCIWTGNGEGGLIRRTGSVPGREVAAA